MVGVWQGMAMRKSQKKADKYKVLFLTSDYGFGGSAAFLCASLQQLDSSRFDPAQFLDSS